MVTLILAEFGDSRKNCGGSNLSQFDRFDPSLRSFLETFPDAKVKLYTDQQIESTDQVEVHVQTDIPFDKSHPRYGWRCSDYYRVVGLLESDDLSIYLDTDMFICNPELFKTIIPLTKKFGICVPANSRNLVMVDGSIGQDSNWVKDEDETLGCGFINNMSPISFDPTNERAAKLLESYKRSFLHAPVRGPVNMWRATWNSGINPYFLPQQWCVCKSDVNVVNPICLHVGHQEVMNLLTNVRT